MKFADKLQNLRKASSLSQEQLADKLNVSRQAVSKWESGASYPEMDKLIAMAKLFKCSMDDLVNDEVKDKEIITKKENQLNNYVVSFMNFFIESINMFFSMKFTTLLKIIIELLTIAIILFGGGMLISNVLHEIIFHSLYGMFGQSYILMYVETTLIAFIFISLLLIYIQIYKNRYLDYYLKEKYKKDQIENLDIKGIEENIKDRRIELKNEKIELKDQAPKFVIRDRKGSSFGTILLQILTIFLKAFVLAFIAPVVIFAFVGLIVAIVMCIYLIKSNLIFFGIALSCIGALVIAGLILEFIYKFLINKNINPKMSGILFLVSLITIGIGGGISIIRFRSFEIKNISEMDTHQETFEFRDNLNLRTDENIKFVIDNNVSDVNVEVGYSKKSFDILISDTKKDNGFQYISIDYKYKNDENELTYLKTFLDNLENNIIIIEDNYVETGITITSNENNIKNLIKNLSKTYKVEVNEKIYGYYVSILERVESDDFCTLNNKGYYECISVLTDNFCEYEVNDYNRVIPKDPKNCTCYIYSDTFYSCRRKNINTDDYEFNDE